MRIQSNDDEQRFRLCPVTKDAKKRGGLASRRKGWKRDMILINEKL